MKKVIIDGLGLVFRSFYAFNNLTAKDGTPSGHVYGFLIALQSLKRRFLDAEFIIAWDSNCGRKKEIYPDYKSNRVYHNFGTGVKDIKAILSSMNVGQVEIDGEEADDVIASLVKVFVENGDVVYIYARDKDLLQLVQDGRVIVIWPKTGHNPEKVFDEEEVRKEFGVAPKNLACYLAFRGDTIDNIPGANRLRSKMIAHLSETYHTPQTVYASIQNESLTEFEHATLKNFENQAQINWSLVRLTENLQLEIKNGNPNKSVVDTYLEKYGIKKISSSELVDLFDKNIAFNHRNAPALVEFSLFPKE